MPYVVRTDANEEKEYFYTSRGGNKNKDKNKEAVARLRRLMNTNFKDNSVNVELSYKTKTEAR